MGEKWRNFIPEVLTWQGYNCRLTPLTNNFFREKKT